MCYCWSHMLQPVTNLTTAHLKLRLNNIEQKSFAENKWIDSCATLLAYHRVA